MAGYEFDFYELKDNDGHKYLVPADMVDDFEELLELICNAGLMTDEWYNLNAEFDNKFHSYMKG